MSRKQKITLVIFVFIVGTIAVLSQLFRKEIQITGFKYQEEKIEIAFSGKNRMIIKSNCQSNELCPFYEKIKFYQYFGDVKLHVVLDSLNVKRIDTVIIIPYKNKMPVLSFKDPKETISSRDVFLFDQTDKRIAIP